MDDRIVMMTGERNVFDRTPRAALQHKLHKPHYEHTSAMSQDAASELDALRDLSPDGRRHRKHRQQREFLDESVDIFGPASTCSVSADVVREPSLGNARQAARAQPPKGRMWLRWASDKGPGLGRVAPSGEWALTRRHSTATCLADGMQTGVPPPMPAGAQRLAGRARLGNAVRVGTQSSNLLEVMTESLRATILDHKTLSKPCPCTLGPRDYGENSQLKMDLFDTSYRCRAYAPQVFRQLRHLYNIDDNSFLESLCPQEGRATEISTVDVGSKSGQRFYISHDGRYFMKTMPAREAKRFRKILPAYFKHMQKNAGSSLLCRFFGLLQLKKPYSMYVVIMNNVFDTERVIHQRFDMKGSTVGRYATAEQKRSPVCILKDFDFIARSKKMEIGEERKSLLLKQIETDCGFLESIGMMDYSLLLGVHERQSDPLSCPVPLRRLSAPPRLSTSISAVNSTASARSASCFTNQPPVPVTYRSDCSLTAEEATRLRFDTALSDKVYAAPWERYLMDKPKFRDENADSMEDLNKARYQMILTESNEGALNEDEGVLKNGSLLYVPEDPSHTAWFQKDDGGMASSHNILVQRTNSEGLFREAGDEVYYLGIIDFLQQYDTKKRIETCFKSLLKGKDAISCVHPSHYSKRFRNFVSNLMV